MSAQCKTASHWVLVWPVAPPTNPRRGWPRPWPLHAAARIAARLGRIVPQHTNPSLQTWLSLRQQTRDASTVRHIVAVRCGTHSDTSGSERNCPRWLPANVRGTPRAQSWFCTSKDETDAHSVLTPPRQRKSDSTVALRLPLAAA